MLNTEMECPACGERVKFLPKYPEIGIYACPSCKFMVAVTDDIEYTKIYSEDYFDGTEYLDYTAEERVLKMNFKKLLNTLIRTIGRPRKVLEIGCAYGFFLDVAKNAGIATVGIDISKDGVEFARKKGHHAINGNAEDPEIIRKVIETYGQFDVVVLWDVLEHIRNVDSVIENIKEALKPGGYIVLTTVDAESKYAQKMGKRWRQIHPPTHVSYFGATNIKVFLQRHNFRNIKIKHIPHLRGVYSIFMYLLQKIASPQKIKSVNARIPKAIKKILMIPFPIYTGDYMLVIAQWKGD